MFPFIALLSVLWGHDEGRAFEVVAHRGVHQTFTSQGLTMKSCTARMIFEPQHDYLENTVRSLRRAFALGATAVEVDVQPTRDGVLALFHDWTLNCRTEASCAGGCACDSQGACVTADQTWDYLRTLDVGYGYTADGGQTFPFRGQGKGLMPRLEEAVAVIAQEFPEGKLLVNVKGNGERTTDAFLGALRGLSPETRGRILYPRNFSSRAQRAELERLGVGAAISQNDDLKACLKPYVFTGLFGYFPEACRGKHLAVPLGMSLSVVSRWLGFLEATDLLWGWPEVFLEKAHEQGTKVYPAQVNSVEELRAMQAHPFDGIMTDKIEVLAPHLGGR